MDRQVASAERQQQRRRKGRGQERRQHWAGNASHVVEECGVVCSATASVAQRRRRNDEGRGEGAA